MEDLIVQNLMITIIAFSVIVFLINMVIEAIKTSIFITIVCFSIFTWYYPQETKDFLIEQSKNINIEETRTKLVDISKSINIDSVKDKANQAIEIYKQIKE